ncbi:MAG: L,D-transpeptidase [Sporolactobacillus sp.]
MYIVVRGILNKKTDNRYYLKLNRKSCCLEIYESTDTKALWDNYPIKQDFDASDYVMYELAKIMPCIFGGDGQTQTPAGIFNIEKVSSSEYISPYHPKFDQVKFFGYLVVFEDYFIHSDMYSMEVNIDDFREKTSISCHDKHTAGCIRVLQDDLYWLIENIPEGTTIEM